MEELFPVAMKQPQLTPKAIIHQKFGAKACYRIEEVSQPAENSLPGLAMTQKFQNMYRCYLDLPELSVTSEPLPKKKDAEQAAAKIAIEKLGVQFMDDNITPQEAMDELSLRLAGFFRDEFLTSDHPLVRHIAATLRTADHFGMIPMSAISTCDTKVNNLCKVINPKAESDPLLVLSLISRAATMSSSICITSGELWLWKQGSYPTEFLKSAISCTSVSTENTHAEALLIPCSLSTDVETITLTFSNDRYYMDDIAHKLNVRDSSRILASRVVGKSSSEVRLYFSAPDVPDLISDSSSQFFLMLKGNENMNTIVNERASHLSGQHIYGDAILAHVGYTWKSPDLFYEDVSLSSYYRMILGKLPDGHYKLLREAILGAKLPSVYTTRSNWKGPTPRELLSTFCRQNRLSEPLFSIKTLDYTETYEPCKIAKRSKVTVLNNEVEKVNGDQCNLTSVDVGRSSCAFKCDVTILSKEHDPIAKCSYGDSCRKEYDAVQCASLKLLSWLNLYFNQPDVPIEIFLEFEHSHGIVVHSHHLLHEIVKCLSIYDTQSKHMRSPVPIFTNQHSTTYENGMVICKIDGPDSGIFPSQGSVVCISYVVNLMMKDKTFIEVIENKDEFDFEIGIGAVVSELELCVSQLTVNQSAQFVVEAHSWELIFTAAGQSAKRLSQLPLQNCLLEYTVKLLQVTDPLEDRIEQALFSPPLSKQRVEFAVGCINELHATSLVDFGCGSGSLLVSLLEHTTTLEKVAGVDISLKGLLRAAKFLHLKLNANHSLQKSIRSTILYDGSITEFDSRLDQFDIGTCLEVIEHMEEDQARLFGDIALGCFRPGVLVVSTPNYEYNPILQRSSMQSKDDSDEKGVASKFRNHDHKFEWTRQQFQLWANSLAARHHYSVEFSGVGGSVDVEPGFASQIAVFKRGSSLSEKPSLRAEEPGQPYEVIWEWTNEPASL